MVPLLLDLEGNGFDIDPLFASSFFADLNGDGQQARMAWAGKGTGVLVIDADGDGKISQKKEFAFTKWDANAKTDLEAIKNVFDTNHNGKLDAGDARWSQFKVWVNGNLVTLASLGFASINLTPSGSGQTRRNARIGHSSAMRRSLLQRAQNNARHILNDMNRRRDWINVRRRVKERAAAIGEDAVDERYQAGRCGHGEMVQLVAA
jgi:hypothetical protein